MLRKLQSELKFQSNIARSKAAKAFLRAAFDGNVTEVQSYINAHAQDKSKSAIHVHDKFGNNVLMFAANFGHEHIVKLLLDAGLDIDVQNQSGVTALHSASAAANFSIVKLLVKHGANLTLKTNATFGIFTNLTAEDLAAIKNGENYRDIADFLRESHILQVACGKNEEDLDAMQRYIKNNPNIMNIADEKENNILDIAAMSGSLPIVQVIVNEVKNIPASCFYEAIKKAKKIVNNEKVIFFLQANFFLNAVKLGNVKDVENCLINDPNIVNVVDEHGNNALILAAERGHEQIVKMLLAAHINIDAQNHFGDTALHWAANKGNFTIVRLLVNNGANFALKNNNQHTAKDVAKHENHQDIADFLRRSIILKTAYGKNKDDLKTLKSYIKTNAHIISFADEKGNNILDIAAMSGSLPIVQAIINEAKDIPTLCLRAAIAKAKIVKSNETVIHFLQSNLQHRIISYKTKSHFNSGGKLQKNESKGAFRHETSKTTKTIPEALLSVPLANLPQKYKNHWYVKKAENADIAQIEVVAQELFRLLIPGHPKTRLVMAQDGAYFVASKEIAGAKDLLNEKHYTAKEKTDWNNALRNGSITGLGEMATVARLIHEHDLKNGNQKIDFLNRVIKFDGDWCFAHIRNNKPFTPITSATVALLPFPGNDTPNHWLGCIGDGVSMSPPLLDADLSNHPRIRAEVNHALLKIMLLSDDLIKKFIAFYVINPHAAKLIYDDFIDKRNQMRDAAMKNQGFLNYVRSSQAEKQCMDYIAYLETFKTIGKNFIFELLSEPEKQMLSQFNALRSAACTGNKKLRK